MPAIDCKVETVSPSQQGRMRCSEITLIGCGSAACRMVERIIARGLPRKVNAVFLNSDDDKPTGKKNVTYLGLSRDSMRLDPHPEVRFSHYEDTLEEMVNTFQSADVAVFVMSLGGQTGTALAPVAAKAAFIAGATTLGFAVLPFSAEKVRHTRAKHAMALIKEEMPNTVVLENDRLIPIAGKRPINEAFSLMDTLIWKKLREMMDAMEFSENYVEPTESPRTASANPAPEVAAIGVA